MRVGRKAEEMTTGRSCSVPRERVDQLRSLWGRDGSEKLTAEQIGQHLGLSARAVVGKAHRLKLPPRRFPVTRYCGWIVEEVQHGGRYRIRYCEAVALPGRPSSFIERTSSNSRSERSSLGNKCGKAWA